MLHAVALQQNDFGLQLSEPLVRDAPGGSANPACLFDPFGDNRQTDTLTLSQHPQNSAEG
jgi:hypothetical protein